MRDHASYEEFLYHYELLRTRLEVRQYFLNIAAREVYDNVGQVLSYVRIQFAVTQNEMDSAWVEKLTPGYQLIGQSISDLRNMCKLFDPEENVIKKAGLTEVVKQEVQSHFPKAIVLGDDAAPGLQALPDEKRLLVLGIILELLLLLKEKDCTSLHSFSMKHSKREVQFNWQYTGSPLQWPAENPSNEKFRLPVFERARLLGGILQCADGENGLNGLILQIPL